MPVFVAASESAKVRRGLVLLVEMLQPTLVAFGWFGTETSMGEWLALKLCFQADRCVEKGSPCGEGRKQTLTVRL